MKTWYSSVTIEHFKYYCIVLYCIMRPYTEGRLDRYGVGIPREMLYLKKTLVTLIIIPSLKYMSGKTTLSKIAREKTTIEKKHLEHTREGNTRGRHPEECATWAELSIIWK